MACTAPQSEMSPRDLGQYFSDHLSPGLFRSEGNDDEGVAWRVAPEPFPLAPQTLAQIVALGDDLLAFYRALSAIYLRSARGTAPGFVADYLDRGKPEGIVKLARQNRFKSELPAVIRPDLILTDGGFIASELDSIPGGMGFVGAMAHTYCEMGFESAGGSDGMPAGLAAALASAAGVEHPVAAIVVSEESADYRGELRWLAERVRSLGLAELHVCAPQDIVFTEDALFVRLDDGREEKIDVLYRNFELFDLLNIPKQEHMLYAASRKRVKMTPPPRAPLEEKLSFALLHHAALADLWTGEFGDERYARLLELFPRTWVLDPRPLPPQASISGLTMAGAPVHDFMDLASLGKGERDYVVKPSGFSELAWGSRGVRIANDLTKDDWTKTLRDGLDAFDRTPYILQRFHKGRRVDVPYLDRDADAMRTMSGRVRLCPYYFVGGSATRLGGILATVVPADKRLIHGMRDAVMTTCIERADGF